MVLHEPGTEILSRLGILDLAVKVAPTAAPDVEEGIAPKPRIQNVNNDDTEQLIDNSDDEPAMAQSGCFGTHFFHYCVIYLCCFIVAQSTAVIFATLPSFSAVCTNEEIASIASFFGVGVGIGSIILSCLRNRLPILVGIQGSLYAALAATAYHAHQQSYSSAVTCLILTGLAFGVVEQWGFVFIRQYIGGGKQKVALLYAILALGFLTASCTVWMTSASMTSVQSNINHTRLKREVMVTEMFNSTESSEDELVARPTKPISAIGLVENQDTKTAENAEKRRLAELQKEEEQKSMESMKCSENGTCTTTATLQPTVLNSSSLASTEATSTSTTTPTTTTTTTTLTTTTTALKTTTAAASIPSSNAFEVVDRSRNRLTKNFTKPYPSPMTDDNARTNDRLTASVIRSVIITLSFNIALLLSATVLTVVCKLCCFNGISSSDSGTSPALHIRIISACVWVGTELGTCGILYLFPFFYCSVKKMLVHEWSSIPIVLVWIGLLSFRMGLIRFSKWASSPLGIQLFFVGTIVASGFSLVFNDFDYQIVALVVAVVILNSIPYLVLMYEHHILDVSAVDISSSYVFWVAVGRAAGPYFMPQLLSLHYVQYSARWVLLLAIFALACFILLRKKIKKTSRRKQIKDYTISVSGNGVESMSNQRDGNSPEAGGTILNKKNGVTYNLVNNSDDDCSRLMSDIDSDFSVEF